MTPFRTQTQYLKAIMVSIPEGDVRSVQNSKNILSLFIYTIAYNWSCTLHRPLCCRHKVLNRAELYRPVSGLNMIESQFIDNN